MSVVNQIVVFFLVIVWGSLVGVLFDCYRILRQIWRPGYWGTSLGDMIFWLLVTFFTYIFLILITWGEVRFYVFLGIGLGFAIYTKLLSRTVRKYLLKLYYIIKRMLTRIIKVLKGCYNILKKVVIVPFRLIKRVAGVLLPSPKPPTNPPTNPPRNSA